MQKQEAFKQLCKIEKCFTSLTKVIIVYILDF